MDLYVLPIGSLAPLCMVSTHKQAPQKTDAIFILLVCTSCGRHRHIIHKTLFVNRYLIPTTIAEILVVVAALSAIRHTEVQKIAAALVLCAVLLVNWYPLSMPKRPYAILLTKLTS